MKSLTKELSLVRTREDLLREKETLSKHFDAMADLMIEGWERYNTNSSEEKIPLDEHDHSLSILL